jgi:hypothetical protein
MAESKKKVWAVTLAGTVISNFATAALAALAMPEVFNFSHEGKVHLAKMLLIPTATHVFLFLKKSPLPGVSLAGLEAGDTATAKGVDIPQDGGNITAESVVIKKAGDAETK